MCYEHVLCIYAVHEECMWYHVICDVDIVAHEPNTYCMLMMYMYYMCGMHMHSKCDVCAMVYAYDTSVICLLSM